MPKLLHLPDGNWVNPRLINLVEYWPRRAPSELARRLGVSDSPPRVNLTISSPGGLGPSSLPDKYCLSVSFETDEAAQAFRDWVGHVVNRAVKQPITDDDAAGVWQWVWPPIPSGDFGNRELRSIQVNPKP